MSYGIKRRKANYNRRNFLKIYFIGGCLIILLTFIIYSNILLVDIRKDVEIVPDLYAKFISLPDDVNLEDFLIRYFMSEIIPNIDYPIILADSLKQPFSWENLDIEKKPLKQLTEEQRNFLLKMIKKLEKRDSVIPLIYGKADQKVYSYVYYGESKTMRRLRFLPYLEMILMIIFLLLGIYGLTALKKTEKNLLWIGLAKETAHQFGTPISSLFGWLDILYTKLVETGHDEEVAAMLNYMKTDLEKLNKIASRFGKVGSIIKHKPEDLHNIIEDTVQHFRRRLPSRSNKITISFESEINGFEIKIDSDLIKWTLENLIKNAIDATKGKGGNISIKAFRHNNKTFIHIRDDGIGLSKKMRKKIFYPGITSKERGWGLGLSLAKRIIEEYHNGKIRVLDSELGVGTTFEIILPEVI